MKRTLILTVLLFCHVAAFAAAHVLSRSAALVAVSSVQGGKYVAKQSVKAGKVAKKAGYSLLKTIF